MRTAPVFVLSLLTMSGMGFAQNSAPAPSPSPSAAPSPEVVALQKKIESFLRSAYAWGPDYKLEIGTPAETGIPGLYAFTAKVTYSGQSGSTVIYVSKDGRYMLRGELQDTSADPNAEAKRAIHIDGSPSEGPANAPVTLVEYADYECPACRQFNSLLPDLLAKNPRVRLVFKDYPLVDVHPWATTAALAARCVNKLDPTVFWKFHDSVFNDQDLISPTDAYDKLLDLASQLGVGTDGLKACMADASTTQALQDEIQQDQVLQIVSTPTVFVNGRRVEGPNDQLVQQYIDYELSQDSKTNSDPFTQNPSAPR